MQQKRRKKSVKQKIKSFTGYPNGLIKKKLKAKGTDPLE
jgi:hypothetical protein